MDPTEQDPGEEQFELAGETFKLLGDVTRLKILWALLHGEHSVTALAAHVGANVPAVSQQLAKLRMVRLVRVRRDGNHLFYMAENAHVRHLVEQALFHTDHVVGGHIDHQREIPGAPRSSKKRRRV
ncbi:MAG: metalloregulator ArsR/SmtB family transcription factor [Actinomycetota bacterium]|nr:metalloregulator ArsR/SmtB family transcription factor [Actinomycetota bacterium]